MLAGGASQGRGEGHEGLDCPRQVGVGWEGQVWVAVQMPRSESSNLWPMRSVPSDVGSGR